MPFFIVGVDDLDTTRLSLPRQVIGFASNGDVGRVIISLSTSSIKRTNLIPIEIKQEIMAYYH